MSNTMQIDGKDVFTRENIEAYDKLANSLTLLGKIESTLDKDVVLLIKSNECNIWTYIEENMYEQAKRLEKALSSYGEVKLEILSDGCNCSVISLDRTTKYSIYFDNKSIQSVTAEDYGLNETFPLNWFSANS